MAGSSLDEKALAEVLEGETSAGTSDLFRLGDFYLHSGQRSFFKIDCDALTSTELSCLARLVVDRVPPFGAVVSVPRGGDRLAAFLLPFCRSHCSRVLIVDDVYTTGESMRKAKSSQLRGSCTEVVGVVLFARVPVTEDWITPLFQMTPATYG